MQLGGFDYIRLFREEVKEGTNLSRSQRQTALLT